MAHELADDRVGKLASLFAVGGLQQLLDEAHHLLVVRDQQVKNVLRHVVSSACHLGSPIAVPGPRSVTHPISEAWLSRLSLCNPVRRELTQTGFRSSTSRLSSTRWPMRHSALRSGAEST